MLRLSPDRGPGTPENDGLAESYRRLAEIFHVVLAEENLDSRLREIADTVDELVTNDPLTVL